MCSLIMDPSVNYSLMVDERKMSSIFIYIINYFFQLIGPKHAIALLVARRGVGGMGTWVNVCWVCVAGLSEPYPIIVRFFFELCGPIIATPFVKMRPH